MLGGSEKLSSAAHPEQIVLPIVDKQVCCRCKILAGFLPGKARVQIGQPHGCLPPDGDIAYLVQLHSRHLLQKEPVASQRGINNGPIIRGRVQALRRQDRSVSLNLTNGIMEKGRLYPARGFEQRLPAQVLEHDLQHRAVIKRNLQFFQRRAGAIGRRTMVQPYHGALPAEMPAEDLLQRSM